jgi:uncharacterized protein YraI
MYHKLNKVILGIIVAVLCFTSIGFNQDSYALTKKQTTANLTLRKSSNTTSSALLVIKKGATVEVLESKSGWDKIKYNGKTGYASSKYLKSIPKTTAPVVKVIGKKQTTTSLTLRKSASTTSSALLVIKKGATVEVLESKNG